MMHRDLFRTEMAKQHNLGTEQKDSFEFGARHLLKIGEEDELLSTCTTMHFEPGMI